ncbi:GrpB family protein [Ideonella azotifigens]|uniref:GrpB family protein n=1 Tax=Ideonella azotifigens TaxID=513160 RepID=A0ABN1JTT8_9BURK|nr:GrpB family protein [Ideonella azotifigens]MCD2341073.1 GrpB family protein [Ideonella azotifigens]
MKVRVLPPNPDWRVEFDSEAAQIHAALANLDIEVHHIGSTAIHGVFAKPIIDMLLTVPSLATVDDNAQAMQALGYEAMGEFGIPGRRYFRKNSPDGIRTHQVHAFERGSEGASRHLAFRDYMNAHAEAAQAYSALKQRLAISFPDDIQGYMDGKNAFVKHHEALALAWQEGQQVG